MAENDSTINGLSRFGQAEKNFGHYILVIKDSCPPATPARLRINYALLLANAFLLANPLLLAIRKSMRYSPLIAPSPATLPGTFKLDKPSPATNGPGGQNQSGTDLNQGCGVGSLFPLPRRAFRIYHDASHAFVCPACPISRRPLLGERNGSAQQAE